MKLPAVPIRLRLALWYTLILAACLIAFSVFVYTRLESNLDESIEDDLEERSALLLSFVSLTDGQRLDFNVLTSDKHLNDTFQRLLDTSGNVVFDNTATYGFVTLDPLAIEEARIDEDHIATVLSEEQSGTVVLTSRIEREGRLVGFLQVGESREEQQEALASLVSVMTIAIPLALAAACLGGFWVSSRALRPVKEVTNAAREISNGDLSRRLNLDLPDDELGRLARTFDEMISRLELMVARQRQFTADASHELRTPLAAMKGQVEVALQQRRDPGLYEAVLGSVNQQIERLTRLVEAMLLLARSDSGRMVVEQEQVDVSQVIDSVIELIAPLAISKGLMLRLEDGSPGRVLGDEALLIQLLLNLADNAVRYTQSGEVVVGWAMLAQEARLYVRDTGPGIPAHHVEKIFEPFYRIDQARSNSRGAGLGLSICRMIAQAHGGRIDVFSTAAGTTFTVSIPAQPVATAKPPFSPAPVPL